MIGAHTLDAWTRPADRSSQIYGYLVLLGGLAAPLFLFLAGVALALAAERALERGSTRRAAATRAVHRGLQIFLLAFLFRLQAFVVSPGSSPVTLFRVDILNVMGLAMAAAALLWGLMATRWRTVAATSGAALLLALATPALGAAKWVERLPIAWQWYLRPAGEHTTFTLFPWAGFVFAGVAAGVVIAASRDTYSERRTHGALAAAAAAIVVLGAFAAGLPPVHPASSFWTSSPAFFAIRAGVVLAVIGLLYSIERALPDGRMWLGSLEKLGRSSLFVYWIHVELVYGYAAWPLWKNLPLAAWVVAFPAFVYLMFRAIAARDRLVAWWTRGGPAADAAPAT